MYCPDCSWYDFDKNEFEKLQNIFFNDVSFLMLIILSSPCKYHYTIIIVNSNLPRASWYPRYVIIVQIQMFKCMNFLSSYITVHQFNCY